MYFNIYGALRTLVVPTMHSTGLKYALITDFSSRNHPYDSPIELYIKFSQHKQTPHNLFKLSLHLQNMCGLSPGYILQHLVPFYYVHLLICPHFLNFHLGITQIQQSDIKFSHHNQTPPNLPKLSLHVQSMYRLSPGYI